MKPSEFVESISKNKGIIFSFGTITYNNVKIGEISPPQWLADFVDRYILIFISFFTFEFGPFSLVAGLVAFKVVVHHLVAGHAHACDFRFMGKLGFGEALFARLSISIILSAVVGKWMQLFFHM